MLKCPDDGEYKSVSEPLSELTVAINDSSLTSWPFSISQIIDPDSSISLRIGIITSILLFGLPIVGISDVVKAPPYM